ncbi:MAG TPA: 30S ribosomal protein S16 [Alphaproteobacteria bacterium]|nr:30S ribosomal protein S16 [Alphaproteobacteria bacterium]
MAVKIRLARSGGRKKLPFYTVVATDARMPRDGRFLEKLGFYNPTESFGAERTRLDKEAITKWLEKGAQPTETLQKMFIKEGIGSEKQIAKWTKSIAEKGAIAKAKKEAEEAKKAAEAAAEAAE